MKPCVFFDRDGIVNRSPGPGYVERWSDFHVIPEFIEVLRKVAARGYLGVVVTNQRGVAKGIMTAEAVEDIHARLLKWLEKTHGLSLTDILYCPHDDGQCDCRKPQPGMLLKAAAKHGIDLGSSWMIGDSESDVEAGHRAGCRTILVGGDPVQTSADFHAANMAGLGSLVDKLL
jgi:D-glycero-D-manno-heptose 1,7-bisphosphate phosphatase